MSRAPSPSRGAWEYRPPDLAKRDKKIFRPGLTLYRFRYRMPFVKPIEFLGDSLVRVREFPKGARRAAGYQLDRVQRGLEADDWKPMKAVGAGVRELRIRDRSGAFRVFYLATLADRIVVLHAFQKKTQRTAKHDIDLAARRFRDLRKD